jgi:hypothetical protein
MSALPYRRQPPFSGHIFGTVAKRKASAAFLMSKPGHGREKLGNTVEEMVEYVN